MVYARRSVSRLENIPEAMRKVRNIALVIAACLFIGVAAAQDAPKPETVDDIISNILKEAPDTTSPPPQKGLPAKTQAPAPDPIVMSARIGEHPDRTRFVVELSDPVDIRTFTLTNPNRVVIDMPPQKPTARLPSLAEKGIVRKSGRYLAAIAQLAAVPFMDIVTRMRRPNRAPTAFFRNHYLLR